MAKSERFLGASVSLWFEYLDSSVRSVDSVV